MKLIEAARAALWLWLACLGLPAHADAAFDAARAGAVAASPAGVSVTLTVAGGKTVFHRGEIIPLTAAFAASVPGRYDLNTDPGSRDLLWNSDAFYCDSPNATDPLRVYYDHEFGMGYSGPGPRFEPLIAFSRKAPGDADCRAVSGPLAFPPLTACPKCACASAPQADAYFSLAM